MNQSIEVKELFTALAKAQGLLKGALKDSNNPFFKSKYADLESCWAACRLALSENGLSVIQTMDYEVGNDFLITTLAHSSGQWIKGRLRIISSKPDAQGMGSALSYSRRYSLAAIIGLIQTDDDGEYVVGRQSNSIVPQQPTQEDGNLDPTSYTVTFGKYKQRSLEEIPMQDLKDYVLYLEEKAKKDNKQIVGQVADFIARADEYICSFENQPLT